MATTTMQLPRSAKGFSLMEMAIVLMILGILMSGVMVSISQTTLNARRAATLAQLQEVEEALYGYAENRGRLPCPASVVSKGYEDTTGATCNRSTGFVPAATLGLTGSTDSDGLLLDSWNNPLRYSLVVTPLNDTVGNLVAGNPDFSSVTSIKNFFGNGTAIAATNMMQICDNSACSGNILTNAAMAVVFTMGENWASYTSANEIANAGTDTLGTHKVHLGTDLIYVSTQYSEDNFDDQIVWLSPYVLFNRMVGAGKLP